MCVSEIKHTEAEVQKVMTSSYNFVSPFKIDDGEALLCVSAMPAPPVIEKDLDSEKLGTEAFHNYARRLMDKTVTRT